jgi:adenylate kinase family enzyme
MVGRIGSGRKTQARLIAQEFGLIFIDFDYMTIEASANDEMNFLGFAQKKLLKPDCLRNGYICVSSVISRAKLEILMEKFIYQPNLIIFLHTNRRNCQRRVERRKGIFTPYQASIGHKDMKEFLNYQMNLYEIHEREFVDYFQGERRRMIIHVDGNKRVEDVKNFIHARLSQQ